MLYYFKKSKNATETHTQKISAVYGEGSVTDWTCQKWFEKFLGIIDVLTKEFFAMGPFYVLEDV